MMTRFILFSLVCLAVFSCSSKEIDVSDLQFRAGVLYKVNSADPFTGKVTRFYENGQLAVEANISDGILTEARAWLENGEVAAEIIFSGPDYKTGKIKYPSVTDPDGEELERDITQDKGILLDKAALFKNEVSALKLLKGEQ